MELEFTIFQKDRLDGTVWCPQCKQWYPFDNGILEYLPLPLKYVTDNQKFYDRYKSSFIELDLYQLSSDNRSIQSEAAKQQNHFDWYADNHDGQTYDDFENQAFWQAREELYFQRVNKFMKPLLLNEPKTMLELACGQGKGTFHIDCGRNLEIYSFDISKKMVQLAAKRALNDPPNAPKKLFFVSDASSMPFHDESFDFIAVFGALHHMQDLEKICAAIAKIVKTGGIYIGSENNESSFRGIFEFMQKLWPQWHEKAGEEPLLSHRRFQELFAGTGMDFTTYSSVYLPPHVLNLLGVKISQILLSSTDRLCNSLPFIKNQGGLIDIIGKKK